MTAVSSSLKAMEARVARVKAEVGAVVPKAQRKTTLRDMEARVERVKAQVAAVVPRRRATDR